MQGLEKIIKIYNKQLDEFILTKKNTESILKQLNEQLQIIQTQSAEEFNKYVNTELSSFLASYMANSKKLIENLSLNIRKQEDNIAKLDEEIKEKFGEIKKIEIILKQRLEKLYYEEGIREQQIIDELTSNKIASGINS